MFHCNEKSVLVGTAEFEPLIPKIMNNYEQLAAAVELFLDSPSDCYSTYLDMVKKSLADWHQIKYNLASNIIAKHDPGSP